MNDPEREDYDEPDPDAANAFPRMFCIWIGVFCVLCPIFVVIVSLKSLLPGQKFSYPSLVACVFQLGIGIWFIIKGATEK